MLRSRRSSFAATADGRFWGTAPEAAAMEIAVNDDETLLVGGSGAAQGARGSGEAVRGGATLLLAERPETVANLFAEGSRDAPDPDTNLFEAHREPIRAIPVRRPRADQRIGQGLLDMESTIRAVTRRVVHMGARLSAAVATLGTRMPRAPRTQLPRFPGLRLSLSGIAPGRRVRAFAAALLAAGTAAALVVALGGGHQRSVIRVASAKAAEPGSIAAPTAGTSIASRPARLAQGVPPATAARARASWRWHARHPRRWHRHRWWRRHRWRWWARHQAHHGGVPAAWLPATAPSAPPPSAPAPPAPAPPAPQSGSGGGSEFGFEK
jgi:hypothetical protein